jgi:hypothetical protein
MTKDPSSTPFLKWQHKLIFVALMNDKKNPHPTPLSKMVMNIAFHHLNE